MSSKHRAAMEKFKRSHDQVDSGDDMEVRDLQRAVKRLNTGGGGGGGAGGMEGYAHLGTLHEVGGGGVVGVGGGMQAQEYGHSHGHGSGGFGFASPVRPPIDEYEHQSGGTGRGGMRGGGAALNKDAEESNAATQYAEMNAMLRELHFARIQRHPIPPRQVEPPPPQQQ